MKTRNQITKLINHSYSKLDIAHPLSGSSSTWFLVEMESGRVFEERGKPEYPEKNLWEKGREPTTNSTHICRRRGYVNTGHIGRGRVLSALRHPYSLDSASTIKGITVDDWGTCHWLCEWDFLLGHLWPIQLGPRHSPWQRSPAAKKHKS